MAPASLKQTKKSKTLTLLLLATVMKKKLLLLQEEQLNNERQLGKRREAVAKTRHYNHFRRFCQDIASSNNAAQKHFFVSNSVVDSIVGVLNRQSTSENSKIGPLEQVIMFLEFVTGGESYCRMSRRLGVSKGSISRIIPFVANTINDNFKNIRLPGSPEEWRQVEDTFARKGLIRSLGALDGKHIRIKAPGLSGSLFYNYKSFFSFVLLILVDGNGKILYMDIGTPGSTNDATIFNQSSLKKILENEENLPKPCYLDSQTAMSSFIVGDGIFPLSFHLMKPYERSGLSPEEQVFNKILSNCRVRVEHVFGNLATKFRVLHKPLECKYSTAVKLVSSLCRIHNMILRPEKQANPMNVTESDILPYSNAKEQREYLKSYLNSN